MVVMTGLWNKIILQSMNLAIFWDLGIDTKRLTMSKVLEQVRGLQKDGRTISWDGLEVLSINVISIVLCREFK